MPNTIAVIDLGSGNLRSVERALAHVGGHPEVTADPARIRRADRLVMPGQGAFLHTRTALRERGLEPVLRERLAAGTPYLGICMGMQILFEESEEHGPVTGLGLLAGSCVRFRDTPAAPGQPPREIPPLKIPHMGWNQLIPVRPDPLLAGIPGDAHFYFVHSYHVVPRDPEVVVLRCDYGGEFVAAVRKDNLFACQFHPEKSQAVGLQLLENFVSA
jgi:glutamine amidotransferase